MSPEQKAQRLFDVADELDRVRYMIDAAEMASNVLPDGYKDALAVLLSEISDKVAEQAVLVRAAST